MYDVRRNKLMYEGIENWKFVKIVLRGDFYLLFRFFLAYLKKKQYLCSRKKTKGERASHGE